MNRPYFFDELGSWSSTAPEGYDFDGYAVNDTHFENAFEWVSDYNLPIWAGVLANNPHPNTPDSKGVCTECERLVSNFLNA